MRNITLSFPDDLIEKGRTYARKHDMSLNALIRDAFRRLIESETEDATADIFEALDRAGGVSDGRRWTRDEIYRNCRRRFPSIFRNSYTDVRRY